MAFTFVTGFGLGAVLWAFSALVVIDTLFAAYAVGENAHIRHAAKTAQAATARTDLAVFMALPFPFFVRGSTPCTIANAEILAAGSMQGLPAFLECVHIIQANWE